MDDRTDDRAFGADDVAPLGPKFRKLRFQMIADTIPAVHGFGDLRHDGGAQRMDARGDDV